MLWLNKVGKAKIQVELVICMKSSYLTRGACQQSALPEAAPAPRRPAERCSADPLRPSSRATPRFGPGSLRPPRLTGTRGAPTERLFEVTSSILLFYLLIHYSN